MGESVPFVLAASRPATTVFENDQVLTADLLNGLAAALLHQQHQTRAALLGVGIGFGLIPSFDGVQITISAGCGVTSDGDLTELRKPHVLSHFRPYKSPVPPDARFFVGEQPMTLLELLSGDGGDPESRPLSELPGNAADHVVVLLVEKQLQDHDVCTGSHCDNLGKTLIESQKFVLIDRDEADVLLTGESQRQQSLSLPFARAVRPHLHSQIATREAWLVVLRTACRETINELIALVNGLPAEGAAGLMFLDRALWLSQLSANLQRLGQTDGLSIYGLLKDWAETWNAFRDLATRLSMNDVPSVDEFPRHLLLGDLSQSGEFRTGFYPSPFVDPLRENRRQAEFLLRRLTGLLAGFQPRDLPEIRVTPSRGESAPWDERAMPHYYDAGTLNVWSWLRQQTRSVDRIPWYHANDQTVYRGQIGSWDFFRIEGHIGGRITDVRTAIANRIAALNLPFFVRSVLIHNVRIRPLDRPPIRFSDLHRLHQLLRRDLVEQLRETKVFDETVREKITAAVKGTFLGSSFSTETTAKVQPLAESAELSLAQPSYSRYQQKQSEVDWREQLKSVVNTVASSRGKLREVVRNDSATAFDTLLTNNHAAWVDWIDEQIQAKDRQEDDRLLFSRFCQEHPQLEHLGGVPRGGTFVLLYDDSGTVFADVSLPYAWPDDAEPEPAESPDLRAPVFRPRDILEQAITVQRPEPDRVSDAIQKAVRDLQRPAGPLVLPTDRIPVDVKDLDLKRSTQEIDGLIQRIDTVRTTLLDEQIQPAVREQLTLQLAADEGQLVRVITDTSKLVADKQLPVTAGTDGAAMAVIMSRGIRQVQSESGRKQLNTAGASTAGPLKTILRANFGN